jgi:hypothetical protein
MQLGLILLIYFTDRSQRSSSSASATSIDGSGPSRSRAARADGRGEVQFRIGPGFAVVGVHPFRA